MRRGKRTALLRVLRKSLGTTDFAYYRNLRRIERLARRLTKQIDPTDRILDLGSGAFLFEIVLEDLGYKQLTAVDIDNRLVALHQKLRGEKLLRHTTFSIGEMSEYSSSERYGLIILHDSAYYPRNDIISLLPHLSELLEDGGVLFFDVYDVNTYKQIRFVYNLVRQKYQNRRMYDLERLNCALSQNGFEIEEVDIELGTKNLISKAILGMIYFLTGKALVVNFLVRKKLEPATAKHVTYS